MRALPQTFPENPENYRLSTFLRHHFIAPIQSNPQQINLICLIAELETELFRINLN